MKQLRIDSGNGSRGSIEASWPCEFINLTDRELAVEVHVRRDGTTVFTIRDWRPPKPHAQPSAAAL